ncbi:dynein regulatory complex subunit 7 isoform X1 [Cephus cinctus]|uniref:Dynein regulatory complex subunit 7 isoform X1 n=1 Tax=Cephus cinctus TaxID=211228 RepID=A0AAJ7R7U5_CEPCN|nr:dynein regulatory complex subunit 7 isoform X1 [Cephus cinctus]
MPEKLKSPTSLMNNQRGNSFECATLLVSLLLGQGYNAFVVSGYASREQVYCDLTKRPCPYLPKPAEHVPLPPIGDTSRYKLKSPPDLRSQFLLELEEREQKKIQDHLRCQEEERQRMISELERPLPDEYWGFRIHAWVVILPERGGARDQEVLEPFFIEPSTGESYSPTVHETNLLYLGIESIWNDCNYWVNMQQCTEGCAKINWNLKKVELWEHLLPGEPWTLRDIEENEADEDINIQQDKHLDMPVSYVERIDVHSLDFERRFPNGRKCMFYKKTKVELYAPYVQMDGLIQRVTLYDDYEYMNPISIFEKFSQRADYLIESKKELDTDLVVDSYKRGRPDACKEHRYFANGNNAVDQERTLEFYDNVRLDGLSRIEMQLSFLEQTYIGRDDLLYCWRVDYSTESKNFSAYDIHYREVMKITEWYHRDESIPASKNIAIKEFAAKDNEIRLQYHYEKDHGTAATRTFIKPSMADRGDRLIFNPEMTQAYNPNPMAPPEKNYNIFNELEKQLKEEERSLAHVREAELEIWTFLKTRAAEYLLPKLQVSVFDRNRNQEAKAGMFAREEMLRAQGQREVNDEIDYLGPYLARIGNPTHLTKAQAMNIKQECLSDLKQLYVDRANHILQLFEKCNQKLERRHSWFTKTEGLTREEEERFFMEAEEMNFMLHALNVRLSRYRTLAPDRYEMILQTIEKDPRLAVLYQ